MAESTDIKDAENNIVPVATDQVEIGGESVVVQRTKQGYGADGEYHDMPELPASDAVLHHVLRALQILASRTPLPTAAQEVRCRIESANNAAMNVGQWAGQTAATGAGAAGNGAPRVTPSNDTVAGLPHIHAFQLSLDVRNFRNRIVT